MSKKMPNVLGAGVFVMTIAACGVFIGLQDLDRVPVALWSGAAFGCGLLMMLTGLIVSAIERIGE